MFRTARKIAAEIARVVFGPTWVEEEYVKGLVAAGRREERLQQHLGAATASAKAWQHEAEAKSTHLHTCWRVAVGSPEAGAKADDPEVQAVVKMRRTLDHLIHWMRDRDDADGSQFGVAIAGAVESAERDAREGVPGPEVVTRDTISQVSGSLDRGVWKQ